MFDPARAIKLLQSVRADIEACRVSPARGDTDCFDVSAAEDPTDDPERYRVEWPNLAIMSDEIGRFLDEVKTP